MNDANQKMITGEWASPAHVVSDLALSLAAKRSLLASWAPDARAVPNYPSFRRLDDGQLVSIDDVLDALKALDDIKLPVSNSRSNNATPFQRGHWSRLSRLWRRRHDDDDDDPPPAVSADWPKSPVLTGGSAAVAQAV